MTRVLEAGATGRLQALRGITHHIDHYLLPSQQYKDKQFNNLMRKWKQFIESLSQTG
jgi:hypothetical protein